MSEELVAALVTAAFGVLLSLSGRAVLRRIREPEPDEPEGPADAEGLAEPERKRPRERGEPKELYAAIAELPHLTVGLALASALVGALVGWEVGWRGVLLPWAFLVPVGVLLGLVDARTRFLPSDVIMPSYGVILVLILLAAWIEADVHVLIRAVVGWLLFGGVFVILYRFSSGQLGYGDVRLAGLLGLALGSLGIGQVLGAMLAGSILGGVGGLVLLAITRNKYIPYGPWLLLGALVGIYSAPWLVNLGY